MWIACGKNPSRGTICAQSARENAQAIFQPSLDHALSKSVGLVAPTICPGGEGQE